MQLTRYGQPFLIRNDIFYSLCSRRTWLEASNAISSISRPEPEFLDYLNLQIMSTCLGKAQQ